MVSGLAHSTDIHTLGLTVHALEEKVQRLEKEGVNTLDINRRVW